MLMISVVMPPDFTVLVSFGSLFTQRWIHPVFSEQFGVDIYPLRLGRSQSMFPPSSFWDAPSLNFRGAKAQEFFFLYVECICLLYNFLFITLKNLIRTLAKCVRYMYMYDSGYCYFFLNYISKNVFRFFSCYSHIYCYIIKK